MPCYLECDLCDAALQDNNFTWNAICVMPHYKKTISPGMQSVWCRITRQQFHLERDLYDAALQDNNLT